MNYAEEFNLSDDFFFENAENEERDKAELRKIKKTLKNLSSSSEKQNEMLRMIFEKLEIGQENLDLKDGAEMKGMKSQHKLAWRSMKSGSAKRAIPIMLQDNK